MPAEYHGRLTAAGFRVAALSLIPRPTPLPGDINAWLETFAEPFLNAVVPDRRQSVIDQARADLRPRLLSSAGVWIADYVRLRFATVKEDMAWESTY